jgi:hypothetical protein
MLGRAREGTSGLVIARYQVRALKEGKGEERKTTRFRVLPHAYSNMYLKAAVFPWVPYCLVLLFIKIATTLRVVTFIAFIQDCTGILPQRTKCVLNTGQVTLFLSVSVTSFISKSVIFIKINESKCKVNLIPVQTMNTYRTVEIYNIVFSGAQPRQFV